MIDILLIIAIILLAFLSAFFSGSEIALFSLSSAKVRLCEVAEDPRKNLIARLLKHPKDLLVSVFFFNTVVNILLQNASSTFFGSLSGWILKVGFPLMITLIFGEIIPKNIALQFNMDFSYRVIPVIAFLNKRFSPLLKILSALTTAISRVMFSFLSPDKTITKKELYHALKTSEKHGVLRPDETELMKGYLKLKEAHAKELMRPREEILFYDINEPLEKLTHLFVDQECSRVPVCDQTVQNVIGIMVASTYFIHNQNFQDASDITSHLTKPFFVPESAHARSLLSRFNNVDRSLALVVDEYGTITGLITYEDLVEVVIGEIIDRRNEKSLFTRNGDNVIIAGGKLELNQFEDIFGIPLVSENKMVTVGGWLTEQMGDIPPTGTHYRTKDFLFHILASDPNRVRRIYIRKIGSKPTRA